MAVSVRSASDSYVTGWFLAAFFSFLLLYLGYQQTGIIALVFSSVLFPYFLFTDRIVFDGKRLRRSGVLPNSWAAVNHLRRRLKLEDIESIETSAVRNIKFGGRVYYRYNTTISGRSLTFCFSSGGRAYRNIIKELFAAVPDELLDIRSRELRDYFADPKEVRTKAELAQIPSNDLLLTSMRAGQGKRNKPVTPAAEPTPDNESKAHSLRRLGNELKLSGRLLQALEAFRRASVLAPTNGWLLYEFARCLRSFAGAERNLKLTHRAFAMIRLAERRGSDDEELLIRIGQTYFRAGEWRQAARVFRAVSEKFGESYQTAASLAEIALREGKIAHVIHKFARAADAAKIPALKRWSGGEAEYFSRLNNNEEYMELEISRVDLLEKFEWLRSFAAKFIFPGFAAIALGAAIDDAAVANSGWIISSMALAAWAGSILGVRALSTRIPFELVDED